MAVRCQFCRWLYTGADPQGAYWKHLSSAHPSGEPALDPQPADRPMLASFKRGLTVYDRRMLASGRISPEGFEHEPEGTD